MVTMQNWNAALPQLELQDVNIDVQRGDAELSLGFQRAAAAGARRNLELQRQRARPQRSADAELERARRARGISFPGWRLLLPDYLSRLDAGSGAFDLAARGTGRALASADLDFAAQDVVTQLSDGPSAKFQQISGALSVVHAGDRWTLCGRGCARCGRAGATRIHRSM